VDKIGPDAVENELRTRFAAEGGATLIDSIGLASLDFPAEVAAEENSNRKQAALNAAVLGRLIEFIGDNNVGATSVDNCAQLLTQPSKRHASRIRLDPSPCAWFVYYTGAIIEINVKDLSGSLGGGDVIQSRGNVSRQDVPACGFSLGLERIIVVMNEREISREARFVAGRCNGYDLV